MRSLAAEWLKLADSDYQSSLYLFEGARYPQALYLLCQALEKVLKTAMIQKYDKIPPKIHNLFTLLDKASLRTSQNNVTLINQLNVIYRTVRYSDIAQARYNTRRKTEPIFIAGTQLYLWIKQQL